MILTQVIQKLKFLVVLIGVAGSLYFSEVMDFPPCILCWYQRILFYPLLLIYVVSLWTDDQKYQKYVFPFLILGTGVALYHNLLYFDIISKSISPCTEGASCTEKQLELFGFITIPLMSLFGFLSISFLEVLIFSLSKKRFHSEE